MRNKTANYFINPCLFLHPFSMLCALQQIVRFYSVNCRPLENAVISSVNVDGTCHGPHFPRLARGKLWKMHHI